MPLFEATTSELQYLAGLLIGCDASDVNLYPADGPVHEHGAFAVNVQKWDKKYIDLYIWWRETDLGMRDLELIHRFFISDRVLPATSRAHFYHRWNVPKPCLCKDPKLEHVFFVPNCPICGCPALSIELIK